MSLIQGKINEPILDRKVPKVAGFQDTVLIFKSVFIDISTILLPTWFKFGEGFS